MDSSAATGVCGTEAASSLTAEITSGFVNIALDNWKFQCHVAFKNVVVYG